MSADSSAMDPRPLPPGWMTQWNERYRTWFYINTNVEPPVSVWEHPSDTTEAGPVRVPVSRSSEIDSATRGSVSGSAHANDVFDDDQAGVAVRRRENYNLVSDDLGFFSGNLDDVAGHHLPLLRVEFEHHLPTLATHPPCMMVPFEPGQSYISSSGSPIGAPLGPMSLALCCNSGPYLPESRTGSSAERTMSPPVFFDQGYAELLALDAAIGFSSDKGATGARYCYVLDHPDLYGLSPYQLVQLQQAAALYQEQQEQSSLHQQEQRGLLPTSISGSSPATTTAILRPVAPPAPYGHLS